MCIFSYFSDNGQSRRAIGRKYNIPEGTLRAKLSGVRPPGYNGPQLGGRLLTDQEEQLIANWIEGSQRRAMPMSKEIILKAVDDILDKEKDEFPR